MTILVTSPFMFCAVRFHMYVYYHYPTIGIFR